jgi:hypothetical protein
MRRIRAHIPPAPPPVPARHPPRDRVLTTTPPNENGAARCHSVQFRSARSLRHRCRLSAAPPPLTTCGTPVAPRGVWRLAGHCAFAQRRRKDPPSRGGCFTPALCSSRFGGLAQCGVCRRRESLEGLIRRRRCRWTTRKLSLVRFDYYYGSGRSSHDNVSQTQGRGDFAAALWLPSRYLHTFPLSSALRYLRVGDKSPLAPHWFPTTTIFYINPCFFSGLVL